MIIDNNNNNNTGNGLKQLIMIMNTVIIMRIDKMIRIMIIVSNICIHSCVDRESQRQTYSLC